MRAVIVAILSAAALASACATTQRTVVVRDGDRIVLESDGPISVVRRRQAAVRTIFLPSSRELIVLLDYDQRGKPRDGRPDFAMRYSEVEGEWPFGERWEAFTTVLDYTTTAGFPRAFGLMTARGLIQIVSGGDSSAETPLRDPTAAQVLMFRGGGSSVVTNALNFDEAERQQLAVAAKNRSIRTPGALSMTATSTAVRLGTDVAPPKKIRDAAPIYPDAARAENVAETVILEVTVEPDGSVTNPRVVRGHPLLNAAAMAAVRAWKYEPTIVNGKPLAVSIMVSVPFVP